MTSTLSELARQQFPDIVLTQAERELLANLARGSETIVRAHYSAPGPEKTSGNRHQVRGSLIRWLCTHPEASRQIDCKGILLRGAIIDGGLDLEDTAIPFPLALRFCRITGPVTLRDATTRTLIFEGCRLERLDSNRADIVGSVILAGLRARRGITFEQAKITGTFDLRGASFGRTDGVAVGLAMATIQGSVLMRDGFRALGLVSLSNARIDGHLDCSDGLYFNRNQYAIAADDILVGRRILFAQRFAVKGRVLLDNAKIGLDLVCSRGRFISPGYFVLSAKRLQVEGSVYFRETDIEGGLNLEAAVVHGDFDLSDAQIRSGRSGYALYAPNLNISGSLKLDNSGEARRGFRALGELHCFRAQISGDFSLVGARVLNSRDDALEFSYSVVGGEWRCRNARFYGCVRGQRAQISMTAHLDNAWMLCRSRQALDLLGARIGDLLCETGFRSHGNVILHSSVIRGDLDFSGGEIDNGRGVAITADAMQVHGSAYFIDGFKATGQVRLVNAAIDGSLECGGGTFRHSPRQGDDHFVSHEYKNAIEGAYLHVGSSIFLTPRAFKGRGGVEQPFRTNGTLSFYGASITNDVYVQHAIFFGDDENGLILTAARIGKRFEWAPQERTEATILVLSNARFGLFNDKSPCWPKPGNLRINGLHYDRIESLETGKRLSFEWLNLQDFSRFYPQPYEQLATVLRAGGRDVAAKRVIVEKERKRRTHGGLGRAELVWSKFLDLTVRYGYSPHRPLLAGVVFMIVGSFVFDWGYRETLFVHKGKEEEIASFSPVMYSVDSFVPIIDFHQERARTPQSGNQCVLQGKQRPCGLYLSLYFWLHIFMGWIVSTLFVISFTRLVRRE